MKLPKEYKESSISRALRSYLLGGCARATIFTSLAQVFNIYIIILDNYVNIFLFFVGYTEHLAFIRSILMVLRWEVGDKVVGDKVAY